MCCWMHLCVSACTGVNGIAEIKAHEFFEGMDWDVRLLTPHWLLNYFFVVELMSSVLLTHRLHLHTQLLYARGIVPPFTPSISSEDDSHYFDAEYSKLPALGLCSLVLIYHCPIASLSFFFVKVTQDWKNLCYSFISSFAQTHLQPLPVLKQVKCLLGLAGWRLLWWCGGVMNDVMWWRDICLHFAGVHGKEPQG